jgi:AcrR family transcriptional regulator
VALREEGKRRRRRRIVGAVVDIVAKEGLPQLSVTRLAEQAEVSVATLYNLVGGLEQVLDYTVAELSAELGGNLERLPGPSDPGAFVDAVVSANVDFLAVDEQRTRAELKTLFALVVSRHNRGQGSAAGESPALVLARAGNRNLAQAIAAAVDAGDIDAAVEPRLLAEQMVFAQSILFESWAAGVISLPHFERRCRYHLWSLLAGWARGGLASRCRARLLELQREILRLDRGERRRA